MYSKIFRPLARSLLPAAIFSLFAAAFADDKTKPLKPVAERLESDACRLCVG